MKKSSEANLLGISLLQMNKLQNRINRMNSNYVGDTGATMLVLSILFYLYQNGRSSNAHLATEFGMANSSMSRTIGRLIRINWVKTVPDAKDRRRAKLSLTKKGKDKVLDASIKMKKNLHSVFTDADLDALIEGFKILKEQINQQIHEK